ncbi:MAG: hypothetical protein JW889_15635 [Verrucomicrobia bacterium]|nr:hypothetical protein [Verrucomicrobiota bacterium]
MDPYVPPKPDVPCAEHKDRPATAYCSICFRPMCDDCCDLTAPEPCCRRCSVEDILSQMRKDWTGREERKRHVAGTPAGTDETQALRWRRFGLAAVAIISLLLMVTTFPASTLRGHQMYALNLPTEGGPGLNGCLREMWNVRGAIEAHLARSGTVPHTLSDIVSTTAAICPASNKRYVYERQDAVQYVLDCPAPEIHRVSGIRVRSGSAPVILDTSAR